MGKKLDKLMADMSAELEGGKTEPETTPAVKPAPETKPEPGPEPEKEPETAPAPAEKPHDEPPADGGEPEKDKPAREIPDDPVKRAEFSFRRQLAKSKEKHEKELADRDAKYKELEQKFAELEKKLTPKAPAKTRDDFIKGDEGDEAYIDYLTQQKVNALMAQRDEEQAKKDAEKAEQERQQKEQEQELVHQQKEWLSNVDQAFGGDKDRSKKFLDRVQFCNERGLGEVLDCCPVAADYLIHDPMGPVVFEKLLADKAVFERVFDPRRTSPLSIYYELREVEKELRSAPPAAAPAPEAAPAQPARKPIPNLGRPGRQAGASSMTATDMFSDPKLVKQWLREHR